MKLCCQAKICVLEFKKKQKIKIPIVVLQIKLKKFWQYIPFLGRALLVIIPNAGTQTFYERVMHSECAIEMIDLTTIDSIT